MGKTVFSKAFDKNQNIKNDFMDEDDFYTAVLYANNYLLYNKHHFFQSLQRTLLPKKDSDQFSFVNTDTFDENILRENTAYNLNAFKSSIDSNLLLVIDGIDEIPAGLQDSLLKMIPKASQLDEGVYVILTARNYESGDEVWEGKKIFNEIQELVNICDITTYQKTLESEEYRSFIETYLQQEGISKENQQVVFSSSRESLRMTYLSMYVKAFKSGIPLVIDGYKTIVRDFLHLLYSKSGNNNRYKKLIIELLTVLSIYKEPLSFSELTYLLPSYQNDFELLGILFDLSGLIAFYRTSYEHNRYGISHQIWKDQIDVFFEHEKREMASHHLTLIQNLSDDIDINDQLLINSAILNLKNYHTEKEFFIQKVLNTVENYEVKGKELARSDVTQLRVLNLIQYMELYIQEQTGPQIRNPEVLLLSVYSTANFYKSKSITSSHKKAEEYFKLFFDVYDKHNIDNEFLKHRVLNSYGLLLLYMKREAEAFNLFETVVEFFKRTSSQSYENKLMYTKSLSNTGLALRDQYFKTFNPELILRAIEIQEQAIALKKENQNIAIQHNSGDSLAFTIHSQGLSYYFLAIDTILQKNSIEKNDNNCKELIQVIDKAISEHAGQYLKTAVNKYTESLCIFEKLDADNYNVSKFIWANCLSHAADACLLLNEYEKAQEYYLCAYDKFSDLIIKKSSENAYKMGLYTVIHGIMLAEKTENKELEHRFRNYLRELKNMEELRKSVPIRAVYSKWIETD